MTVRVRSYEESDAPGLAKLFSESVTNGTGEHYSDEERKAWASAISSMDKWSSRLASMTTLVAEDSKGLAGFMTLEADGHIDLAYVRSDLIGRGVAAKLYNVIEAIARERKLNRLYAEASHLARPFFERRGWTLIKSQRAKAGDQFLINHRMHKFLL